MSTSRAELSQTANPQLREFLKVVNPVVKQMEGWRTPDIKDYVNTLAYDLRQDIGRFRVLYTSWLTDGYLPADRDEEAYRNPYVLSQEGMLLVSSVFFARAADEMYRPTAHRTLTLTIEALGANHPFADQISVPRLLAPSTGFAVNGEDLRLVRLPSTQAISFMTTNRYPIPDRRKSDAPPIKPFKPEQEVAKGMTVSEIIALIKTHKLPSIADAYPDRLVDLQDLGIDQESWFRIWEVARWNRRSLNQRPIDWRDEYTISQLCYMFGVFLGYAKQYSSDNLSVGLDKIYDKVKEGMIIKKVIQGD